MEKHTWHWKRMQATVRLRLYNAVIAPTYSIEGARHRKPRGADTAIDGQGAPVVVTEDIRSTKVPVLA
jgi:hypothetical protein